ncbi:MAG: DUF692 family multinuclear iron-containing protein, partial [Thermaurantiacus sp.]
LGWSLLDALLMRTELGWSLLDALLMRTGPRPVLIEWDTDVPDFAVLHALAARAAELVSKPVQTRVAA